MGCRGARRASETVVYYPVWHCPTDPTTAAYLTNHLPFPLPPPSILPQAALEEIHRFSGTYTCMNTFKGRT